VVTVQITDGILQLRVSGVHKVLAVKGSIEFPLESIETVQMDAAKARAGPEGMRNFGTSIPGVVSAGSFTAGVNRSFWDVHNPENAIWIKLNRSRTLFAGIEDVYDEVVVEVAHPAETVAQINRALAENRR
jgi:hypothetical protein